MTDAQAAVIAATEAHHSGLEDVRAEHARVLSEEQERHSQALAELEAVHASERDTLRKAHTLLEDEVAAQKTALGQAHVEHEHDRQLHQTNVDDLKTRLATMEQHLQSVMSERAQYASGMEKLRAELDQHKAEAEALRDGVSARNTLAMELEKQRATIDDLQSELLKTKGEKDVLLEERQRQDAVVQALQAQVINGKVHRRDGSGDSGPTPSRLARAATGKLPPLTPPPNMPPPPLPIAPESVSSHTTRTSTSSQGSRAPSPEEQSTPSTSVIMSPPPPLDPRVASLLDEQAKHLEEQETMIKTLNKQLTHCEADLQAHMDLVATLEASLTDSERNRTLFLPLMSWTWIPIDFPPSVRKARLQSNELAKERDSYQQQMTGLRQQIVEAQQEASNMRRSVLQEKESLESRLAEERRAKERARAQLDSRMEEMALAKRRSKFVCL